MGILHSGTIDVFVHPQDHDQFWWSAHGLQPSTYGLFTLHYRDAHDMPQEPTLELITKGFVRSAGYPLFLGDHNGNAEQPEDFWAAYGLDSRGLLAADRMYYGRRMWSSLITSDSVEFDSVFHPAETLSVPVVQEAVSGYCRTAFHILSPQVRLVKCVSQKEIRQRFQDHLAQVREAEEFRQANGYACIITIPTDILSELFNPKVLAPLAKIGIDHGFIRAGHYFAKLKDGTEESIPHRYLKPM